RRHVRGLDLLPRPAARPQCRHLLRADHLQRDHPAAPLVEAHSPESDSAVPPVIGHPVRHVVRAIRDHHSIAAAGLPAVVVGRLLADLGRPRHPQRHDLLLPVPVPAVPALHPVHPGVGDEGAQARDHARRGARMSARVPMRAGLMAEYASPEALLVAVPRLRGRGCERLDAYTPYRVKGADEALGLPRSVVPRWVLAFALCGPGGAYFLQWWMNAYTYPINVGARPPHS